MLYGGGECVRRFGVPFWRMNREQDVAASLARSGSVGGSFAVDGTVRQASANRLRTTWVRGAPYLLVEDSVQNLAYHTQDFAFTGANQWSRSGLSGVTADAVAAPDGGMADKLVEDSSNGEHRVNASWGIGESNGQTVYFSVFASPDERSEIQMEVSGRDGVNRTVWFDLSDGTVGTASGAVGRIVSAKGDSYRCTIEATVGTGGITSSLRVYIGSGSETRSYLGDGSSGLHLWQADIVLDDRETTPIPASTTLVTRSADTLSAELRTPPRDVSIYMKFLESGSINRATSTLFHYGGGDGLQSQLTLYNNSGYRFYQRNDSTEAETGAPSTSPTEGQVVELAASITEDGGTLTLEQSIEGGAIELATSAGLPHPSSWPWTQLYLGSRNTDRRCPALLLSEVLVARRVHGLAELRAAFP